MLRILESGTEIPNQLRPGARSTAQSHYPIVMVMNGGILEDFKSVMPTLPRGPELEKCPGSISNFKCRKDYDLNPKIQLRSR